MVRETIGANNYIMKWKHALQKEPFDTNGIYKTGESKGCLHDITRYTHRQGLYVAMQHNLRFSFSNLQKLKSSVCTAPTINF